MSRLQPPAGRLILTYEDYQRLPDDGRTYEIWEGELQMTPAPAPRHQDAVINLGSLLRQHVRSRGLGKIYIAPIDVVLDFTTVVQPDLLYLSAERLHLVTEKNIAGAPDLVVEVLSPGTAVRDRLEKAQLYARKGVPHLWILDPERRSLETYRLRGGEYALEGKSEGKAEFRPSLFPELAIDLGAVWE